MKNLKKLLCMVLCLALLQSVAFAAPEAGTLFEIYDSEPELYSNLPSSGIYSTTDVVTFDDQPTTGVNRGIGANLESSYVTGRSGQPGDYALKITANSLYEFSGNNAYIMTYENDIQAGYKDAYYNKPVVTEFDIKLDTNCDDYGLKSFATWAGDGVEAYDFFGKDGKILGTDYSYEANKWYHFKWVIDAKKHPDFPYDNGWVQCADVYITPEDGVETKVVDGAMCISGPSNQYEMSFIMKQATTKPSGSVPAGMTIDNWRQYNYKKPAGGKIVSPEGASVPSNENFIFRVTAEAATGDEIDLRVDGTSIATFDAREGVYDYAADVDHCTIDAGAHVLSAYKVTDGFEEKIAEKIISIAGKYAGAIPSNGGVYPTGTETFDNLDTATITSTGFIYGHRPASRDGLWTDFGIEANAGASGQPGDNCAYLRYAGDNSHSNQAEPDWGIWIVNNENPAANFTRSGIFEMEFDLKVSTNTDAVALFDMGLWHNENVHATEMPWNKNKQLLLNGNGKVSGTNVEYAANTWMHFKLQYDFDNDKWYVWKDLNLIVNGESAKSQYYEPGYDTVILSLCNLPDEDADNPKMWLDNLRIEQYFNAPALASVSYATDSASGIATTDLSVTDAAKSVTLTLDKDVDAVADANVEVLVNDVAKAVSGVSYSAKAVTIPLPAISAGDKVSVTLKGVKAGGTEIGNISATLNVKATGLYIAQNKIIGSSIKTQMYNGGADKEAMLVAVVFDGNRMTDVSIITETIPSGETVYTFPLKAAPGEKEVKLMVWDNGMQPILEKAAE